MQELNQVRNHAQIAEDLFSEYVNNNVPKARELARQGDVVVTFVENVPTNMPKLDCTPNGGVQVAAGKYGEHRLIAKQYADIPNTGRMILPEGGMLVHTDVPTARHGPIFLEPGVWSIGSCQELSLEGVVQKAAD